MNEHWAAKFRESIQLITAINRLNFFCKKFSLGLTRFNLHWSPNPPPKPRLSPGPFFSRVSKVIRLIAITFYDVNGWYRRIGCQENLSIWDDAVSLSSDSKVLTSKQAIASGLWCVRRRAIAYHSCRDNSVYAPSQWDTTLHCNVVSHWLGAFTNWSLQPSERISQVVQAPQWIQK